METMQIDKICRACLREDDKMIDMHEKDVYQKFLLFANLEEIPDIPLNLCQSCEKKLNISMGFKEECQTSHEILLNYIKNTREVKFEATSADTHQVDSEVTADANKPSRLQQISHNQVWEAIKDLKQNVWKNKNINCIQCSYVGNNLRSISLHISKVHKDLKQRWCGVCNAEFDNLTNHVATNHSNDYPCKFCSKKFPTGNRLTAHLRNHSDVKPFSCSFCKRGFLSRNHLNVHLIRHSKIKPFKCGLCKKSFTRSNMLKKHLEVHKSEGDADEQLAALKLIKQMHISKGPIKCTYCDKEFKSLSVLTIHERKHTGDKPYICQVCGKNFSLSGTLKTHMMVHNIGNKKSCNICNKKFISQTQLIVHLRTHTGEKPFVCTECGKAFIGSQRLTMHYRIHSTLRPYQCKNCDKSFKIKSKLIRHMLIHSGEKPYKCSQCAYACSRGDSLTKHMTIHVVDKPREDRPHVCLMCNKTFTTDAVLTSHINTHTVRFLEI